MNAFKRLLNLYQKSGKDRTPTEDFCTECLSGILESDRELLDRFVKEVLNIPSGEPFRLFTQETYFLDGEMIRVDLVFESLSWLCFLEMKVQSTEGDGQLERYREFLTHPRIHQDKKTALRYCTLYLDLKEGLEEDELFEQFRWKDIANFLSVNKESNQLVHEFYQFLKEEKMAGNERFTYQDLIGLQSYGELTSKVDEILQLIQKELKSRFGKTSGGVNNTGQVKTHGRLAIWCEGILGDWSEVLAAFRFSGSRVTNGPQLMVQLWISKNNDAFNDFRKAVSVLDDYSFTEDMEAHGGAVRFEKPLADFIESENQIGEIKKWITEKLDALSQLKAKTGNLNWKMAE